MKNYSETEFHNVIQFVLTQQLVKSLHLLRESGAGVFVLRCFHPHIFVLWLDGGWVLVQTPSTFSLDPEMFSHSL